MVVRRPSLDDYDRGDFQYFAERISSRAQGLYGEEMQPSLEHRPAVKIALSKEQSAKHNAEARKRKQEYDARREESMELYRRLEAKRRKEQAALREREYALAQERAKLRQQWLEDQRKAEEAARKRREQFLAQEAEWRRIDKEKREAEERKHLEALMADALTEPRWGQGTYILLTDNVPVRWNDHPAEGHIHMKINTVWNVGAHLATAIVSRGYAMVLNAS